MLELLIVYLHSIEWIYQFSIHIFLHQAVLKTFLIHREVHFCKKTVWTLFLEHANHFLVEQISLVLSM